jgi:hypothetical protein
VSPLNAPDADEVAFATNVTELVFRNITSPLWSADTRQPSSHAFGPSKSDHGKPSYIRSSLTSAQEARTWHTANANSPSLSVWACSVGEVLDAGSQTIDDSAVTHAVGDRVAPGHCYVDFRCLTKSEERVLRSLLLAFAIERQELTTVAA